MKDTSAKTMKATVAMRRGSVRGRILPITGDSNSARKPIGAVTSPAQVAV